MKVNHDKSCECWPLCNPQLCEVWTNRCNIYRISQTIRRTMIFSLYILEKNNDECILILVTYWEKIGLVHTKISNHNIIYSS